MPTIAATWNTVGGDWFSASNWTEPNPSPPPSTLNYVPGSNNDVSVPDNTGDDAPFAITYDGTDTVNTLDSGANVTLDMTGGSLEILNGGGFNAITLASGVTLQIAGGVQSLNAGTFTGSVTGAGTLNCVNGDFSIEPGVAMDVANWVLNYQIGSATVSTTTLYTSLTYAQNFEILSPDGDAAYLFLNGYTLTLSGTAELSGQVSGPGRIDLMGSSTIGDVEFGENATSGYAAADAMTLQNTGSATQVGFIELNGTIDNALGGEWVISSASSILNDGATFINGGTLQDVASGQSEINGKLTNSATISVASGAALDLADGVETLDGIVSGGGELMFGYDHDATLDTSSLTVASIYVNGGNGGGTLSLGESLVYSGAFTFSDEFGSLDLRSNTLTLAGSSVIEGGSAYGPGDLDITGSATIGFTALGYDSTSGYLSGHAVTIENDGSVSQVGYLELNGTIKNNSGDTWTFASATNIANEGAKFLNSGTLDVAASGQSEIDGEFVNSGTISISSGADLDLADGVETLDGIVSGGGELVFGAGHDATLDTSSLTVSAVYVNGGNEGGTLGLGESLTYSGAFTFADEFGSLDLRSHTLTLAGGSVIEGEAVDGAGALDITGSATIGFTALGYDSTSGYASGHAITLENAGSVSQVGYLELNGTIENNSGATWTFASATNVANQGAKFLNSGTLDVAASGQSEIDGTFVNSGTISISSGADLDLAGGVETLKGTVTGGGELVLGYGHDATLDTSSLTVSAIYVNGGNGGGTVSLEKSLTYGGDFVFSDEFGSLDLEGHTLTLTGSAALTGGTLDGPGAIDLRGPSTLGYIGVGDAISIVNTGSAVQVGGITLSGTILNQSGASWTISSASNINNDGATFTNLGTIRDVASGASQIGGSLINSGTILVSAGAVLVATGGESEGRLVVFSGATLSGITMSSGGLDSLYAGGTEDDLTVLAGGTLDLIDPVIGAVVTAGPLASSSTVSGVTLSSGAMLATFGAQVVGGGMEIVTSGGTTTSTVVQSGGSETVSAGGVADATSVHSGGTLVVAAGATASEVGVGAGGVLVDDGTVTWSGAATSTVAGTLSGSGALVEDGPGVLVLSDTPSDFTGSVVISGGTVELERTGAVRGGSVDFAGGGGVLEMLSAAEPANGATFAPTLAGFDGAADCIDLRDQAFVSGASATVSGSSLTLTDGAYVAHFVLGAGAAAHYKVTSDGFGGTLITPDVEGPDLLTSAMAVFGAQQASPSLGAHPGVTSAAGSLIAAPGPH